MSKHRLFNFALFTFYIIGATAFMVWEGIGISPDRYVFILLLLALVVKKTRSFLLDWTPFLFILLSYDFLRGFADNLGGRVNFIQPIEVDKLLFFGINPTLFLQGKFYNPTSLQFHDYLATSFYFLHFALPLAFGFLIWMKNRQWFREFITALLILSYSAWVTYIIYPAAPPWMASQENYLPGVVKILDTSLQAFPERLSLPTVYHQFNPNPVAAIPSLHAAYPFLVFLFCLRFFKKRGWLFLPYVLAMWISIVYLGEHYVIDAIIGGLYALASYIVAIKLLHNTRLSRTIWKYLSLKAWFKRAETKQLQT